MTESFSHAEFNTSLNGINDDALFSATDLEKVLRGTDPDSGNLPSRLWDVVDNFDPVKLEGISTHIMSLVSRRMYSDHHSEATDHRFIITAQQIAGISRRLVTTDSSTSRWRIRRCRVTFRSPGRMAVGEDKTVTQFLMKTNRPLSDDFKVISGLVSSAVRRRKLPICCITAFGSKAGNM